MRRQMGMGMGWAGAGTLQFGTLKDEQMLLPCPVSLAVIYNFNLAVQQFSLSSGRRDNERPGPRLRIMEPAAEEDTVHSPPVIKQSRMQPALHLAE